MVRFRKTPTVEQAKTVDEWTLLHGRFRGREIAVRRNATMDRVRDRDDYPVQVGIAIPLLSADDRGFPSATENERLFEIEDAIEQIVGDRGVFVAALTTAGVRELLFYSESNDWVAEFQHDVAGAGAEHTLRVVAKQDPSWSSFFMFTAIV